MLPSISSKLVLLFAPVFALGWFGTRTALHIRLTHGQRGKWISMLAVGWFPLLSWVLALLTELVEGRP